MTSTTLSERDLQVVAEEARARRKRAMEAPVLGLLGVVLVTALVELVPRLGIVDRRFLPPASEIFAALFGLLGDGKFWQALLDTTITWATGLAIAMVLGVGLGMLIGSFPVVREFVASTIEFLRPIPSVALIPLVVLLLGTYHFRFLSKGYWVVWPTALPYVVTGFRLAATVSLVLTLTGELIIGTPGLGQQISIAQSSNAVPMMYALIVVAGILGVGVNVMARFVEAKALFWHPSVRKESGQ